MVAEQKMRDTTHELTILNADRARLKAEMATLATAILKLKTDSQKVTDHNNFSTHSLPLHKVSRMQQAIVKVQQAETELKNASDEKKEAIDVHRDAESKQALAETAKYEAEVSHSMLKSLNDYPHVGACRMDR
jgi:cell division protein FtsB